MSRTHLIQRIEALSDDDLERVAPYIEADLEALPDLQGLLDEIALGRESARAEPLVDDADVVQAVRERLRQHE